MRLRESRDAFTHAIEIAEASGAGTLVYVGRFDLAEFAVVLEPNEPLRTARRAFYAGMVALTDALRAYAPPNKPVTIDWPDAIRIDGGLVGGGRLGWPSSAKEDEPPPWLVFGAMIRTVSMTDEEPGVHPLASALEQEGFGEAGAVQVTESFARHLMATIDAWQADGFDGVAREFLSRLSRERQISRRIDDNGDLLTRRIGTDKAERRDLHAGPGRAVLARSETRRTAVVKLLRTIALDPSDTFVFDVAAEPGDWAVSGAFRFCDRDPAKLTGKDSFGLPQRLSRRAVLGLVDAGADRPRDRGRSPYAGGTAGRATGRSGSARRILQPRSLAAEEEVAFAQSLCTHPIGTLIAVHRSASDGEVRESFRRLQLREGQEPRQGLLVHGGRGRWQ